MHQPLKALLLIIIEEMKEMFLGLEFSQMVAWTLASLSDKDISTICDVIRRTGNVVGWRTPDMGNQISIFVEKRTKLAAVMFKSIEH